MRAPACLDQPTVGLGLRPLRWPDIEAVAAIEAAAFPEDAWSAATFWAELAERPRRDYRVATLPDGQIVGYAGSSVAGTVADVMTVAVDPARRGTGAGRRLLVDLLERVRAGGAHRVMLEVRADNAPARGLYAAHGFEILRVLPRYYRGGVDALVMGREVADG